MTEEKTLMYIIGGMISIIIYFMKGILSDIKYLKINDSKQDKDIAVVVANHNNLHQSVGELKESVRELNASIQQLISKMPKQ